MKEWTTMEQHRVGWEAAITYLQHLVVLKAEGGGGQALRQAKAIGYVIDELTSARGDFPEIVRMHLLELVESALLEGEDV